MKRFFLLLLLVLAAAIPARAQITTVNATVVDPNGIPYKNATISAQLIVPGGASPTLNGAAFNGFTGLVGLDANGKFSVNLADNNVVSPAGTKWQFTICAAAGNPCATTSAITITGGSQDISATLNALVASQLSGFPVPFPTGGVAAHVPFSGITSGTNITAAMVVGNGATLEPDGAGGIVTATNIYPGLSGGTCVQWGNAGGGHVGAVLNSAGYPCAVEGPKFSNRSFLPYAHKTNATDLVLDDSVVINAINGISYNGFLEVPEQAAPVNPVAGTILSVNEGLSGGLGYVINDTGTVNDPGGATNATYIVDSTGGGGVVLAFHITATGTAYTIHTGDTTTATLGVGTGLLVDVTNVTGSASDRLYLDSITHKLTCLTSTGGSCLSAATVTSFSAGTLSPLFTTSVATPTTTPALTFTISNAGAGTLFGNPTGAAAAPIYTSTPVLGLPGTTLGTLGLAGNTSGTATIQPQAVAGTPTLTLPNTTGTFAVGASAPLSLDPATGNLTCSTCVTSFPRLDQVLDPTADKTFSMTNKALVFNWSSAPASATMLGLNTNASIDPNFATCGSGESLCVQAVGNDSIIGLTQNAGPTTPAIIGVSGITLAGSGAVGIQGQAQSSGVNAIASLKGFRSLVVHQSSGVLTEADGMEIAANLNIGGGSITSSVGLVVLDQTAGISNWAIKSGLGLVEFGDKLILDGSTSGSVTITPQAVAGTPTITWGTSTGTPAVTASSPLAITAATGNITCATCATASSLTTNRLTKTGTSPALADSSVIDNGTTVSTSEPLSAARYFAAGTHLVAGDFASSGWGAGASISVPVTSVDQAGEVQLTAGTVPSLNPTVTLTFHDGTWTTPPVCTTSMGTAGTGAITDITWSSTATALILTYQSTPIATFTYQLTWHCIGIT